MYLFVKTRFIVIPTIDVKFGSGILLQFAQTSIEVWEDTNRSPYDFSEGERELVSVFIIEYGSEMDCFRS